MNAGIAVLVCIAAFVVVAVAIVVRAVRGRP